jgi:hypothetical protein
MTSGRDFQVVFFTPIFKCFIAVTKFQECMYFQRFYKNQLNAENLKNGTLPVFTLRWFAT